MEISGTDTETRETVDIPIRIGRKRFSDKLVNIIDYGREKEEERR